MNAAAVIESGDVSMRATCECLAGRGRLLISPYWWPLARVIEFDQVVLTAEVARLGSWKIRGYRWQRRAAQARWAEVAGCVEPFLMFCDEREALPELVLGSGEIELYWPRFDSTRASKGSRLGLRRELRIPLAELEERLNAMASCIRLAGDVAVRAPPRHGSERPVSAGRPL